MTFSANQPGMIGDVCITSHGNSNGTAAQILIDVAPATGTNPSGENYNGGTRGFDATASNTDTNSYDLLVYEGRVVSTFASGSYGAVTANSTTVLRRASGSWLADGIRPNQTLMLFAPANAAAEVNEGVLGIVSSVTGTDITFSSAILTASTTYAQTTRLVRVGLKYRTYIAGGAGNTGGTSPVANVSLISNAADSGVDRQGIFLGPASLLIVAPASAVAAGKLLQCTANPLLY